MTKKSAIKTSLFAAKEREQKLDRKGDLLSKLEKHVSFSALAAEIDRIAPRPESKQGGRPPYLTELMVRILVVHTSTTYLTKPWNTNCLTACRSSVSVA